MTKSSAAAGGSLALIRHGNGPELSATGRLRAHHTSAFALRSPPWAARRPNQCFWPLLQTDGRYVTGLSPLARRQPLKRLEPGKGGLRDANPGGIWLDPRRYRGASPHGGQWPAREGLHG